MNTQLRRTVVLTALAIGTGALGTPALADEWNAVGAFGWYATGKAVEMAKGHYYFVGEFSGTFFSDKGPGGLFHNAGIRCQGWNDLNFATGKGKAGGYCTARDAEGDQAFLVWESAGTATAGKGTFTFTGGTGKYQAIKGTYPFSGVNQVNWPDGVVTGYATWNR